MTTFLGRSDVAHSTVSADRQSGRVYNAAAENNAEYDAGSMVIRSSTTFILVEFCCAASAPATVRERRIQDIYDTWKVRNIEHADRRWIMLSEASKTTRFRCR